MQVPHSSRRLLVAALRCIAGVVALCMTVGCHTPERVERLESQLRRQEDSLRSYQARLSETTDELARAEREIEHLNRQLAEAGSPALLPEHVNALARVEALSVDPWRTGLINQEAGAGVDQLLLVLYPHDGDGEVVKVSGELEVEAIDLSRPTSDQVLGRWTFTSQQAADLWNIGFVSTGFHVHVPLPEPPMGTELLLRASLSMVDGREFSVTHTLPVRGRGESDAALPLFEQGESVSNEASSESLLPLPATSRSVLVPEPPGDDPYAAEAGYTTEPAEGATADDRGALDSDHNRHRPTTTSDNWMVEEIPSWR